MTDPLYFEEVRRIARALEEIGSCLKKLTETAKVTTSERRADETTVDEPRTPTVTVA
jgi:hypothetical protein